MTRRRRDIRSHFTVDQFDTMDRIFAGGFAIATLCAIPIIFNNDPSIPGTYPSCPSKWLGFAWDCPGCGTTRMVHRLLHFRFAEAFSLNPMTFICSPFIGYFVAHCAVGSVRGMGLPRLLMPVWLPRAILITVVAFGIGRNIV